MTSVSTPLASEAAGTAVVLDFVLHEELLVSYVLDVGFSVPGPTRHQSTRREGEPALPAIGGSVRPALRPGTRVYLDEAGAIRWCPAVEPRLQRKHNYLVAICARRELAVAGDLRPVWRLLQLLDGTRTTDELLAAFPAEDTAAMTRLLAELAEVGAVDVSNRPIMRYVHDSTKRGAVVTGTGTPSAAEVWELTSNGAYRAYPDAQRVALGSAIPPKLGAFHDLTRRRRSGKGFGGEPVARGDFDALLLTACGVTGSVTDGDRTLRLRAYPAGGALYGIEVYPVVLAVTDLPPAIYHYRVVEHELETLRARITREELLATTLPIQQAYLEGAAAVLCLTANFARFERKYGQSGYRALAAEAGVLAQNLILAATALGLRARPIGGFFDDLLNPLLGLDTEREQFMLAVLLGHPPPSPDTAPSSAVE